MEEDLLIKLIICGASVCGFLGLLGIGYAYDKWFRLTPCKEEMAEQGLNKDFTFPITLDVVGRVASKEDSSLHFLQRGTIQSSHALPHCTKAYFEIELIDLPSTTRLYVGLAPRSGNNEMVPGCTINTVAAECQGGVLINEGSPTKLASPFLPGDTIGFLAFHGETLDLSLLRDGKSKSEWSATKLNLHLPLLPTIHATGPCSLRFNFGQRPFKCLRANFRNLGLTDKSHFESPPIYIHWSDPKLLPPFQ